MKESHWETLFCEGTTSKTLKRLDTDADLTPYVLPLLLAHAPELRELTMGTYDWIPYIEGEDGEVRYTHTRTLPHTHTDTHTHTHTHTNTHTEAPYSKAE